MREYQEMKRFLLTIAILFLAAVAATAGGPLKVWDYVGLKDVRLYSKEGNKATMRVSPDTRTPGRQDTLEVSLDEFSLDAVPWSIQLRFVYDGALKAGHSYEVSFLCKGSVPGALQMVAALEDSPWTTLPGSNQIVEISQDWQAVKLAFTVKNDWAGPLAVPRFMPANYGDAAILYFGPATLRDISEKQNVVESGNLIFNSSFELEDAGFNFVKYLYPPTNPEMKYEGAEIDTSTFVSGKQSLKMPNRFADEVHLYPHEVSLQPDTEYTYSLWLKADKPNTPVSVHALSATGRGPSAQWAGLGKSFVVSTDWKRYNYTFTTKTNAAFDSYIFWIAAGLGADALPATIWIDDLQLAQGKEKPYESGSEIECACIPKSNYIISNDGSAKVASTVKVSNNSQRDTNAKFTVSAVDDYSGKTAFSKNLEVPLKAGEIKEIALDIPVNAYGSYIVDAKSESHAGLKFRSQASCFGVIGKYERKPIDLGKTFCLGFNGPSTNISGKEVVSKAICFRAMGCGQNDYAERLEMMGCRLLRDWTSKPNMFVWKTNEPEDCRYDFQYADRGIALFAHHGITILPVLDPHFTYNEKLNSDEFPEPEWMRNMRMNGEKVSGINDYGKNDYRLVPMEKWRAFVKATVSHFKGKISHYEIVNEPNLFCPSAKVYMDYLKASFEEIRKADPDAKVVGFCSTGDMGGKVERFLGECFALDGLKYADIVSWHPYDARELSSQYPADRQIADIKALNAKYGKSNIPVWNTEGFFLYGTAWETLPPYKPYHAARRLLMDLGEGVAQSMPVQECTVWKNLITPNFKFLDAELPGFQLMPNSNYVFYNAFARFFEGAKPIGKFRWGDSAICYAYEREGHFLAAFWDYGRRGGLQVKLPGNVEDTQLFDLFGNKMPFDGQALKIDFAPCYLTWKGGTADSVRNTLSKVIISGGKPFRVESALLLNEAEGTKLLLNVRNMSGKTIDNAKASVVSSAISSGVAKLEAGGFKPMELKEIEIPVQLDAKAGNQTRLKVELSGADKPFQCVENASIVKALQIKEGNPSQKLQIEKPVIGKPESPDDLSAFFTASYERNTLLLDVKVRDDKRSQHSDKGAWDEDAIQIYLDAFPLSHDGSYPDYSATTYKIVVAAWRDGDERVNASNFPGKITADVKSSQDGYELQIRIPLTDIPGLYAIRGKRIGFDISVEDSDSKSRKTEIVWNGTVDNYRNRSQFAILEFK
ncbi:MAG: sugar-binding protein [Terrimicrobiaceae bacterium]